MMIEGWISASNELNHKIIFCEYILINMFAGVGVVNCIPGAYGYVIANIEMILGFIMMGIAIGTLTRRFVR